MLKTDKFYGLINITEGEYQFPSNNIVPSPGRLAVILAAMTPQLVK